MTNPTRRPTAKQRGAMLEALESADLTRTTSDLQARTVAAMAADGWVALLGADGNPAENANLANRMRLLEHGAGAIGKRLEFGNKLADGIARRADDAIVRGWRYLQLGTEPIAHTGPSADFTHSCDRCGRRFVGEFDTWGDVCGFCRWGTVNALAPHVGGLYPVADGEVALPVHAQVPNTVGAACFMQRDESTPDGAQQTTNARKVTCPDCLDIDVDALQARRRVDAALERAAEPAAAYEYGLCAGGHMGAVNTATGMCDGCGLRQRIDAAAPADGDDVSPAPGTLDELLLLVTLYGDERAEAVLYTAAAGNYDAAEFQRHAALAAQHVEQIETIARRLFEPRPPMTREQAHKLLEAYRWATVADVEANADDQSDDTLDAAEAIMYALAGPEQGEIGAGLVAVPAQRAAAAVFVEPVAALPARVPGASLPAELPAVEHVDDVDAELLEQVAATLEDVDAVEQNARVAGDEPGDVDADAARQNAEIAAQLDRLAFDREQAAAERARAEQITAELFPIGTRVTFTEGGRVQVGDVRTIYPGGRALWVVDDNGVGHSVGPRQARPVVTVELPADEPVELSGIAAAAVQLVDEPADPATVPGTPEYAAATMAAAVPTGTPLEQQFVYTFGAAHNDPATGEQLGNAYVVFAAPDRAAADRAMFARYADEWAFGYAGERAVAVLTNYPEMRQVQLAPELQRVTLDRLEMGPNGYTLRGDNGVALFRAHPIGDTGGYELSPALPGLDHSSDSYADRASADRAAEYLLQKWMRGTLGVLVDVVVVVERD